MFLLLLLGLAGINIALAYSNLILIPRDYSGSSTKKAIRVRPFWKGGGYAALISGLSDDFGNVAPDDVWIERVNKRARRVVRRVSEAYGLRPNTIRVQSIGVPESPLTII